MNKRIVYRGEYKDIRYEINNFSFSENEPLNKWTFYLYLLLEQFPEEIRERIKPKEYFTHYGTHLEHPKIDNPLHDLEWHCGITWLSKEAASPFFVLKAGCDYQHLWDEEREYSCERIEADAKKCIDSLYKLFPTLTPQKTLYENFRKKFPGKEGNFGKEYDINGKEIYESQT